MNCPYCDHDLSLKDTPQGLYGRCSFCRFSGYIPTGRSEHPSNEDIVRSEHPSRKIEEPSNEDTPEDTPKDTPEDTPEDYTCPVCGHFYKTEGGIKRHFQRVSDEEEIHPTIYKRHDKYFSEGEGT